MSINKYTTKKGTFYRVQVYAGKTPDGRNKMITRRGFRTKKEAKLAEDKLSVEIASKKLLVKTNITFGEVYEDWLETYELGVKPQSAYVTKGYFKNHILPELGQIPIQKITIMQCQKLVNTWVKQKKSNYRLFSNYVSKIFEYAMALEYVDDNPISRVKIPTLKYKHREDNYYTKAELELFLQTAKDICTPKMYALFRLLAFSGVRIGEALALSWQDIDFEHHAVNINKTALILRHNGEITSTPKTRAGKRTVYVDKKTLSVLQQWQLSQRKKLLEKGINANALPNLYVYNSDYNLATPVTQRAVSKTMHKVIKQAGLRHITVHGLRHTYATLAIQGGMSPKELQTQLGHSDIKTTLQIYTAVTDEQMVSIPDKFTSFVNF